MLDPNQLNRVQQESSRQDHDQSGRRLTEVRGEQRMDEQQNREDKEIQEGKTRLLALEGP